VTNLARSQSDWNKLFRELGFYFSVLKDLRDRKRRHSLVRNRISIKDESNVNAFTSSWNLSGVNIGTNTDDQGRIFVRIVDESPGANQATVNLYRATGAGGADLVATGNGANGATITLSASNSSGLTGTVVLGTVTANEANDNHYLRVFPDYATRARALFDGTETDHLTLLNGVTETCKFVEGQLSQCESLWKSALTTFLRSRWSSFHKSSGADGVSKNTTTDQGAITTSYSGQLEDARQNMSDELTAGAQKVLKNTVSAGSVTANAANQGVGTWTGPTLEEWARDGLITITCIDRTIGSEKFSVSQKVTTTGDVINALNDLQVGRAFSDPNLGIRSITLSRSLTLASGSSNDFGAMASWSFSGESSTNTNDGVIYVKVTGSVGAWIISGYTSSSYDSTTQVFASVAGAAGAIVAIAASNSSGLSGSVKIGSAPTNNNTGSVNLNPFRIANVTNAKPDVFTCQITCSAVGEFQYELRESFGYALNSAASGSQTLSEDYVIAGSFPPYSVRDTA
jgi:hypothetical protein